MRDDAGNPWFGFADAELQMTFRRRGCDSVQGSASARLDRQQVCADGKRRQSQVNGPAGISGPDNLLPAWVDAKRIGFDRMIVHERETRLLRRQPLAAA